MEIERKFLIKNLPIDINSYPHYDIEQGYILTNPVLRVRKANDKYVFTYKSKGMLSHEEINVPIEREAYDKLLKKIEGKLIKKTRYKIPLKDILSEDEAKIDISSLFLELDFFKNVYDNGKALILAEIEFPTEEIANKFCAPSFFSLDVTFDKKYHNNNMINNWFFRFFILTYY